MDRHPGSAVAFRARVFVAGLRAAAQTRRIRPLARAIAGFLVPGRWPPPRGLRATVLDRGVARGSAWAAHGVLEDLGQDPEATRAGRPAARRRAAALAVLASTGPASSREVELAVVSFLRGELGPPAPAPRPDRSPGVIAAESAASCRAAGATRPTIVATFPGFHANPYGRVMERAYPAHEFVAMPVDDAAAVDEVVAGAAGGGYRVVVHLNAPDRFVRSAQTEEVSRTIAEDAVGRLDAWGEAGATLIATLHNGPRLTGHRGAAERTIAQAIVDRARLVQILTLATPELLAGWLDLTRARLVHVPHPNYDGAYAPLPDRDEARRRLGFRPGAAANGDTVVGLLGTLIERKGPQMLIDALARVPEPLAGGSHLRLLIGGMLGANHGESLIRLAMAEPRVTTRFGFIPDADIPALLAALDIAVVPYGNFLNSGWLHLALTAGIPIIAPSESSAPEVVRPEALRTYVAGDPGSLAEALADAERLLPDTARRAARESVADLDGDLLSERFAQAVLDVLGVDGQPAVHPGS